MREGKDKCGYLWVANTSAGPLDCECGMRAGHGGLHMDERVGLVAVYATAVPSPTTTDAPTPFTHTAPAPVGGTEEAMPGTVGGMIEEIRALRSALRSRSTGGGAAETGRIEVWVSADALRDLRDPETGLAIVSAFAVEPGDCRATLTILAPLDSPPAVPEESKP